MNTNAMWAIVVVLLIVILGMGYVLFATPSGTATITPGGTGTGTGTGTLSDRVVIDAPKANSTVFKNFTVTGKAPGPWYFEASFPIVVRSATGSILASGIATALSDWMTTDDVPFKADIFITSSYVGDATLVLMRDNPSGLPENDDAISIPIAIHAQ